MTANDVIGYLACGLVLLAFCMPTMVGLRIISAMSNVAFITYAYVDNLTPILVLHAALLPVNLLRLAQLLVATVIPPKVTQCEQRVERTGAAGDVLATAEPRVPCTKIRPRRQLPIHARVRHRRGRLGVTGHP